MMRTCLVALLGLVMSAGTAAAQCTVPNSLTNNTNADATQVMANFNALLTCINGLPSPTGNPGFMNRLRNGSFVSWPNGTGGTITTSATGRAAIAANGWAVIPSGASATWARAAQGNNGTTQSLQVTGASGVTNVTVGQRVESFDAAQLAGRTVTFQMAVFNNTGASITPKLSTAYVGSADNWGNPVADVNAVNLQACANGVWTVIAYTFTPNAGAANGYEVKIDFGNNFSTTSKSVQITAAELRMTPGASAGLNSSPPIPEIPYIEAELTRSARYYQTSYANGTTPGASSTHDTMVGGVPVIWGQIGTISGIEFPVRMRATPAMSYWDGAGNQDKTSYVQSSGYTYLDNGVWNIVGPYGVSAHGFHLGYTGTPQPATASYYVHYVAYADFW